MRAQQSRTLERFTTELRTAGLAGVIVVLRSAKERPFPEPNATLIDRFDLRHTTVNPAHGTRADPHAGTDHGAATAPYVRPDLDRLGEPLSSAQLGVHRVGGRVNLHRRAEQGVVPDLDSAHVKDDAVEIEEHTLAKPD